MLKLAEKAGLAKLGHVALDGTKIKANASKHRAMSYERMKTRETELRAEVDRWLEAAQAADAQEDKLHGASQTSSYLTLRHRRSTNTLSGPGGYSRPCLVTTRCFSSTPVKSTLVNWLPWSLLKMSGLPRLARASSSASMQKSASIVIDKVDEATRHWDVGDVPRPHFAAAAKAEAERSAEEKRKAENRKRSGPAPRPPSKEPDPRAQRQLYRSRQPGAPDQGQLHPGLQRASGGRTGPSKSSWRMD